MENLKEIDRLFTQTIMDINDKKQMEQLIRHVGTINMALALCGISNCRKIREHVFKTVYIKNIKSDFQEFFRENKLLTERSFTEDDCNTARENVLAALSFIKYGEHECEDNDVEVEAVLKIVRDDYSIVINKSHYYELYFTSKLGVSDGHYVLKRQHSFKLINRLAFQLSFYICSDSLPNIRSDLIKAAKFMKADADYTKRQMERFGIFSEGV